MESILATCKISQPCPFQGSEGRAYVAHYGLWDRKIRTFNFKSFADYLHSTHLELAKQFRHFGINFRRFIVFDLQFSANISPISQRPSSSPVCSKIKLPKFYLLVHLNGNANVFFCGIAKVGQDICKRLYWDD